MTEPKDVPACPSTSEFTSGLGNWYLRLKAYRRRSGHHQVLAPREQLTQQVPTHQGVPGPWNSLSSAVLTATSRLPWRIQSRRRLPRDHKTNSIPDIACKQLMHNPVAERHTENPRDSLSLSSALPSSSSFLGVGSPTHVRTAIEGVAGGNHHSSSSGKTVHGLRMSCGGDVEENLKDCKCSESDNVRTSLFTSQLVGGLASPPERVSNRAGPVTSDETLHPTLDSRSVSEAHHSSSGTCSVSDKRTVNSIQGTAVCGKNHSASAESAAELRSLKSSRRTRSRPHVRPKFRAAHTTVTGCSCANYNSGIPSFVTLKKHSYSDRRSSSTATVSDGEKEHSSRFKKHERSMLCSQTVHPCDQSESTALKDEGQIRVKQEGRNLSCDGNENNGATGALGKLRRDSAVVALTGGNPHLNHSVRSFSTPAASPNLRPLAEGKTSWWTGLSSFTERLRGSGKGKERNTQSVQLVNEMTGIPQCDVNALPQLCRAHIHVAEFMNDELRGALAHHPMQDEALHLRWRSEASRPLLVHASLDVTCDDISGSVAGCGSSVKVYDIALSVTETFAALRLKCPEGWITAECVDASAWNRCCVCRSRNFCRLWTRDVVRDVDAQESQNIWTSSVTGGCSGTDHQRHYGLLQSCSCLAPLSIEDPSARSLSVSAPNEHECVCMGGDVYLDKERSPSSALVSGGSDHRSSMDMNLKHGPGTSCGMQLSETPMIPRGSSTGCGDGVFGSIRGRMKSQSTNSKDVSVTRLRPVSRTTGKRGVTRLKSYLGINSAGTTCRKRDRKDVEDRERNGASWKRESCLLRCASNATSTQGTYSRELTQRWYFRVCRRRCQPALLCMDKSSREQTSGADRSNISQFATWGAACCAQDSELQGTGKRRLYRHNERRHMCTTGDRVCSEREACTGRGQDACLHGACRLVSEDVVQIWARTEEGWNRTDDEAYPASKGQVALWRNDGDAYGCETRGHSASLVTPGALSLYAVRSLLRAGSGRHRTQCSNDRLNEMQNANAIQERKLEISCRVHEASRRSSKFDALGRNSKKSHVEERHKHPVFGRRAPRGHCSESSVMRGPRMTETSPSRRTDKGTDSYYQVHPSEDVDSSSGGQEERLREQRTPETGFDTDDRAADRPSCLAAVDMLSQDSRTDTRLSPRFEISNRAEVPRLLRQRWLLYRVCGRSVVAVGSSISPFSPTVPATGVPVYLRA
ncbi:hypothetical protein TGRUB_202025 [Toxoplasma gondii RUB]|uniref:Uncharacterized protein n=1 Tax=Toxoplasma gondii RUB TaxID=935652 RepID=A0A086LZH5_TOXGO|nr:hypothetical protein TGRUB_202025 [Toxoplasma gondii RUB]